MLAAEAGYMADAEPGRVVNALEPLDPIFSKLPSFPLYHPYDSGKLLHPNNKHESL